MTKVTPSNSLNAVRERCGILRTDIAYPSNSVTDMPRAFARRFKVAREGFLLSPASSWAT